MSSIVIDYRFQSISIGDRYRWYRLISDIDFYRLTTSGSYKLNKCTPLAYKAVFNFFPVDTTSEFIFRPVVFATFSFFVEKSYAIYDTFHLVVFRISRINFSDLGHGFYVFKEGRALGDGGQVTCQVTYLLTKTASHWQLKHIED